MIRLLVFLFLFLSFFEDKTVEFEKKKDGPTFLSFNPFPSRPPVAKNTYR